MLKAPRLGRSVWARRGAGGMGGRPGVDRWAVLEGSRVGRRLWVRVPPTWVGPSAAAKSEVDGAELLRGGE